MTTEAMISLPMKMIAKHTVSVGRSYSHCMNCGTNYLGERACTRCGTVLAFAASEYVGAGALAAGREYAANHQLEFIGYSAGGYLELGGGGILTEDTYPEL